MPKQLITSSDRNDLWVHRPDGSKRVFDETTERYLEELFRLSPGPSPWFWGSRLWGENSFGTLELRYDDFVLYRGTDAILRTDFHNFLVPLRSARVLVWESSGFGFHFYVLDLESLSTIEVPVPVGPERPRAGPLAFDGLGEPDFSISIAQGHARLNGALPDDIPSRLLWVSRVSDRGPHSVFVLDAQEQLVSSLRIDFTDPDDLYIWPALAAEVERKGRILVSGVRMRIAVLEPDGRFAGALGAVR